MPRTPQSTIDTVERATRGAGFDRSVCHQGVFTAVQGDTFAWIPDASIDLVLTDPPFNIAQDTNFHTWENNTINSYRFDSDKGWDSYSHEEFLTLLGQWAAGFARVLRKGGSFAVFCADEYLSHFQAALTDAGLNVRRTLTWRKPNAVPINRKVMMMSACEYVLVGVKGAKATFNADLPSDDLVSFSLIEQVLVGDKAATLVEKKVREAVAAVGSAGADRPDAVARAVASALRAAEKEVVDKVAGMYMRGDDGGAFLLGCVPNAVNFTSKGGKRAHPTEKPVVLLRYLLQLLSNRGDVVLDPFSGSGSAGEAAIEEGRYPILVERDGSYFASAAARLESCVRSREDAASAYTLFD